ncbi:MAG: hypothetical protein LVQ95_04205 [Candidatus Micrarchaeales archaeon]|nr:hypothetical protein [Candidatus Micrarchaeales archaeon]
MICLGDKSVSVSGPGPASVSEAAAKIVGAVEGGDINAVLNAVFANPELRMDSLVLEIFSISGMEKGHDVMELLLSSPVIRLNESRYVSMGVETALLHQRPGSNRAEKGHLSTFYALKQRGWMPAAVDAEFCAFLEAVLAELESEMNGIATQMLCAAGMEVNAGIRGYDAVFLGTFRKSRSGGGQAGQSLRKLNHMAIALLDRTSEKIAEGIEERSGKENAKRVALFKAACEKLGSVGNSIAIPKLLDLLFWEIYDEGSDFFDIGFYADNRGQLVKTVAGIKEKEALKRQVLLFRHLNRILESRMTRLRGAKRGSNGNYRFADPAHSMDAVDGDAEVVYVPLAERGQKKRDPTNK